MTNQDRTPAEVSAPALSVVTGSEIAAMRVLRKITQAKLAEIIGVRQATVADWERGASKPSRLACSKLAPLMPEDRPCPNCYGGHFRPCQWCGDTGRVTWIANLSPNAQLSNAEPKT